METVEPGKQERKVRKANLRVLILLLAVAAAIYLTFILANTVGR
jgi:hypothetical protein